MIGWPTVSGRFYLWLKDGLYLPIEPKISGPHNPLWAEEGSLFGVGVADVQGRYVPAMNEIHQTVSQQSTYFAKIRPTGTSGPITPHSEADQAQIWHSCFFCQRVDACAKFHRDCLQAGLYLPIEPTISGPHNSHQEEEGVPIGVRVAVVQG